MSAITIFLAALQPHICPAKLIQGKYDYIHYPISLEPLGIPPPFEFARKACPLFSTLDICQKPFPLHNIVLIIIVPAGGPQQWPSATKNGRNISSISTHLPKHPCQSTWDWIKTVSAGIYNCSYKISNNNLSLSTVQFLLT